MKRRDLIKSSALLSAGAFASPGVAGAAAGHAESTDSMEPVNAIHRGAGGFEYPAVPRRPEPIHLGKQVFNDPYRWLADETPEAVGIENAQTRLANAYCRDYWGYEKVARQLGEMVRSVPIPEVLPLGAYQGKALQLRQPTGSRYRVLEMIEADGSAETLLDPCWFGPSMNIFVPQRSPDGRYLSFYLRKSEVVGGVLRVIDLQTGSLLDDAFDFGWGMLLLNWKQDSSGMYYAPITAKGRVSVFEHRLNTHFDSDIDLTDGGLPFEPDVLYGGLEVSPDGRYLGLSSGLHLYRLTWIKDLQNNGPWRRFVPESHVEDCRGFFQGDHYLAISRHGSPRGRLVSIPIESSADMSTWREILPQSEAVIRSMKPAGDRLVVFELVDHQPRMRILDRSGVVQDTVVLPGVTGDLEIIVSSEPGLFLWPRFPAAIDATGITLGVQTFDTAGAMYRYSFEDKQLSPLSAPTTELSGMVKREIRCPSEDGTRVTAWLVHRKDLDTSTPTPCLMHVYAGFGHPTLPTFIGGYAPFVESGGILCITAPRGGGDRGQDWWDQGRKQNKQNCYDDIYAIAETMIAKAITTPTQLAITGISNGAMTSALVGVQRPDLFAAVVPLAAILDYFEPSRLEPWMAQTLQNATTMEYGDIDDPRQAEWVRRASPYHNVRNGTRYPAILVCQQQYDPGCRPWHGNKFVAALQQANTSENPIMMAVWPDAAHTPGPFPEQKIANTAQWLSFVMRHTGLLPEQG